MKMMMIGLVTALLIAPAGTTDVRAAQSQAQQQEIARVQAERAAAERAAALRKQAEAATVARDRARAELEQMARAQAERQQTARAQVERELAARAQQGPGSLPRMHNIRLELTITDQSGGGAPVRKKISLLLAEGGAGRVRSSGTVFRQATPDDRRPAFDVELNVDAQVQSIVGDRVRVGITVEYAPGADAGPATTITADENTVTVSQRGSPLNQSVTVILVDGKPTTIVEAADPASDRKVTLEATATIVR